jgi:magnesium transporter
MIVAHLSKEPHVGHEINKKNSSLLKKALWIDLVCPTKDDEALVEDALALNIPTREEM